MLYLMTTYITFAHMPCIFKIDAKSRKPFCHWSGFPLNAALEDLNAATYGRPKQSSERSTSEAALFFKNVGMPNQRSLEETFQEAFGLWQSCTANKCWKSVPNLGINFKDAYLS